MTRANDQKVNVGVCHLILASTSPRRAAILKARGVPFRMVAPPDDDPAAFLNGWPPERLAKELSFRKAKAVAAEVGDGLILAGDTVAALGMEVFGKPVNRADARRILQAITGTAHQVITALTLLDAATARSVTRHDTTTVHMRSVLAHEIEDYLDTGAWRGKAGAYGIQDHGDAFVKRIDGSFTNVVGLPVELLGEMLLEWNPHGP